MRLVAAAIIAALFIPGALNAQKTAPPTVPVFVTSSGAVNGFTDPSKGNQDTMKNLQDSLKGRKGIVLTDDRDQAKIVLVVMDRETSQITAGFLGGPARDRIIRVKFLAGGIETEMTASAQGGTIGSGGAWGKAAGKIAKQVEDWVRVNGAKLQEP